MFPRVRVLLVLGLLLAMSSFTQANPGGVGDDVLDMQCGGACHGDSSLNQTSSASISIAVEGTPYLDQPVSITTTVSGQQLSYSGTVGLFLLTDVTGHSDTPADADWVIISDSNGGKNNYLEGQVNSRQNNYTVSWTVKPTQITNTTFYISIQHGGDDTPYFGISQGLEIEVLPIPDNLPRLSPDFTPQISRSLGEKTSLSIETEDVSSISIEWKVEGSTPNIVAANMSATGIWEFEVPASNQPSSIQWRAVLEGQGPSQTTPWFTLISQESAFEVDQTAVYIQAFALLLFVCGFVLTLHIKFIRTNDSVKQWGQTDDLLVDEIESKSPPPLPNGQLPAGWNMEQWEWYGHEYIQEMEEGR
jgi:hypothetical protein